ncbi:hypothetical protein EV655_10692 [Rhodovulum euryhalinum]|uniref:Methyl-accepting chemotaxis protein n=1 Tax=Rhodovulum euryhalinum TaxID=35805 RepID=A0A4V2SAI4_9RHOB|nr:hypothetical protein EV655_10692 [Rhodovulum euryhalinum]
MTARARPTPPTTGEHPDFGALRADLERVFLAAGDSLIAMDNRFGELHAPLGVLADQAPAVIEAVGTYASDLTRTVEGLDVDLARRSADIDALRRNVEALNGKVTSVARNLKMMRFVATNARIHVFSLRPRHTRLESFADNARVLLDSSSAILNSVEATVCGTTGELGALTRRAFPDLRAEASRLLPGFDALGRAVAAFGGDRRNEAAFGRRLADHLDTLRAEFEAVIVSLQSGDRASQRIDHAEQILRDATTVPGAAGLVALADAQFAGALADLDAETARITHALADGVVRFEEIAGLQGAATTDERVRAFETLLAGVDRAQAAVDGLRARRERLLGSAEAVMGRMTDLRRVLGDMSSLAEDLRLVGTNAVLASSELAEEGDALREIAGQLRLLAAESALELRAVVDALVASSVRISELIEDIRGGAARAIAEIEDRGAIAARELDDVFHAGRLVTERTGDLVANLRRTVPATCNAMRAEVARLNVEVRSMAAREIPPLMPGPAIEEVLASIWVRYSMDEERDIHLAFCSDHGLALPRQDVVAREAEALDIFF